MPDAHRDGACGARGRLTDRVSRAAVPGVLAFALRGKTVAVTGAAAAAENPVADFDVNVTPMRHLLDACRARGRCPLVLFAGTVTQAGVPSRLPVNEDAVDAPLT